MDPRPVPSQEPAPAGGDPGGLTIGDLAQRTGVSTAVLRAWETRYGFPVPRRLASGHRRYGAADVDLVRQVLRRRDAGVRLETAVAEAADAARSRAVRSRSVFAELRRRHPALAVSRLRKATLVALSHAIEDECCAVADRPVLIGSFQREAFYVPSAARWAELARLARAAVVLADEWSDADSGDGPVRVALGPRAPMGREWSVVCDAPDSAACLAAWELPGQDDVPDRERVFEAVWTIDPGVVRDAARVAAGLAADAGLASAASLLDDLAEPPGAADLAPARATALFNRVLAYVDGVR